MTWRKTSATSAPSGVLPGRRMMATGLPVVPVAVAGSEQVLPKHSLIVLPGLIQVAFGEPISTAGLGPADRDRLAVTVHDQVRALLDRIEPASSGT